MTFVIVGLPGLLIAAVLYLTVAEPRRGGAELGTSRSVATPEMLADVAAQIEAHRILGQAHGRAGRPAEAQPRRMRESTVSRILA